MAYDGADANINNMTPTDPPEGGTIPSEVNNAIREIKYALRNMWKITVTSGNATLDKTHGVIFGNGAHTLTLPQISTVASTATKWYYIRNTHATLSLTLKTYSAEEINGTDRSSTGLTILPGNAISVATDGTGWYTIDNHNHSDEANGGDIVPAASPATPASHALYRESLAKAWVKVTGATPPVVTVSFNVDTGNILRNSLGDFTIPWDVDFSSANYVVSIAVNAGGSAAFNHTIYEQLAGKISVRFYNNLGTLADPADMQIVAFGTNAG